MDDFYRRYVATHKGDDQIAFAYNAFVIGRWIHSTFGGAQAASLKAHDKEAVLAAILKGSYGGDTLVKRTPQGSTHISLPVVIREVKDGGFIDIPSVND